MSKESFLWLVYCATVLWIAPCKLAKTNEAECVYVFSSESQPISVDSRNFSSRGFDKCEYHISAPSRQFYIQLNFTKLFGFVAPKIDSNRTCVPVLSVTRTMDGRQNKTTINDAYGTPYVFQSNSDSIQIIYVLNSCPRESGFTLSYNFLHKENPCAFRCDSSKCLPATSICDGTSDCVDESDEQIAKCDSTRSDHIPYIVIVAFVVVFTLLGVILCFMRHNNNCKLMSRVRQRHATRDGPLRPQSQNSETLVPSPTQDHLEQQVSLLRERYSQINSMMRDGELGYPPQVQRSKDGEEGYKESQKDLLSHRQNAAAANLECFRPPPNKTVHDTESPPPYYSDSPSRSFDSFSSSKTPPSLQDYNGCPVVIRCYSMSGSATGEGHPDFYSNSYSRTHSTSSVGHGGGHGPPNRPPPRYETYKSHSVPTPTSILNGRGQYASAPEGEGRGSGSSSVRSSPPDYHNAFSVNSANLYRSAAATTNSDKANV